MNAQELKQLEDDLWRSADIRKRESKGTKERKRATLCYALNIYPEFYPERSG
jgi:hypothetical protein